MPRGRRVVKLDALLTFHEWLNLIVATQKKIAVVVACHDIKLCFWIVQKSGFAYLTCAKYYYGSFYAQPIVIRYICRWLLGCQRSYIVSCRKGVQSSWQPTRE